MDYPEETNPSEFCQEEGSKIQPEFCQKLVTAPQFKDWSSRFATNYGAGDENTGPVFGDFF